MIALTINKTEYKVKTSFAEMTWNDFIKAVSSKGTIERLSSLTGIPVETLESLQMSVLAELANLVSYFDDVESLPLLAKPYNSDMIIGHEEYGKLEDVKMLFKKHSENIMLAGAGAVKVYTGEDISDKPLLEVYHKAAFFLSRSQSL